MCIICDASVRCFQEIFFFKINCIQKYIWTRFISFEWMNSVGLVNISLYIIMYTLGHKLVMFQIYYLCTCMATDDTMRYMISIVFIVVSQYHLEGMNWVFCVQFMLLKYTWYKIWWTSMWVAHIITLNLSTTITVTLYMYMYICLCVDFMLVLRTFVIKHANKKAGFGL